MHPVIQSCNPSFKIIQSIRQSILPYNSFGQSLTHSILIRSFSQSFIQYFIQIHLILHSIIQSNIHSIIQEVLNPSFKGSLSWSVVTDRGWPRLAGAADPGRVHPRLAGSKGTDRSRRLSQSVSKSLLAGCIRGWFVHSFIELFTHSVIR